MTARRYGWPPQGYIAHPRSRIPDESALTTLVWTSRAAQRLLRDVVPVAPLLAESVALPIEAMAEVTNGDLSTLEPVRPDRLELRALVGSGRPWSSLAGLAEAIVRAETDTHFLAYELIEPDPDLEWRLFHLSVLGVILSSLRSRGARVRWRAPLSASGLSGPQFQVSIGGDSWDLWFEAAGAPTYYGFASPYQLATAGVLRNQRSIGADILLVRPGHKALMFECKWSAFGSYVGRDGYHQAAAYALEARAGLAPVVRSYVIGPEEVVTTTSSSSLAWDDDQTTLGVCNVQHVSDLVAEVLGASGSRVNATVGRE